jgi:hypothetical protein
MKVYFVGAGPGDPELLTVKARRLLEQARVCIYAGSLVSPEVVALLPAAAERHDSAAMDLDAIVAVMLAAAARDVDVVRLHSGEPSLYGAIGEQMDALDRVGIDYEVVPGISAFQASAAALRVEDGPRCRKRSSRAPPAALPCRRRKTYRDWPRRGQRFACIFPRSGSARFAALWLRTTGPTVPRPWCTTHRGPTSA